MLLSSSLPLLIVLQILTKLHVRSVCFSSVWQHKKKISQRKTIFSQWKILIKTMLIFYGMFSIFFFLENSLSLTHHISHKYYFFLYLLQQRETTILAPLSHSLTVSSQFSPFFLLFLSSYSHCLSPSGLSSFQFSQISLYLSLMVNNSSLHW